MAGELTPLRAVLFDLDDTLLRSDMEGEFARRYSALLAEYAAPLVPPSRLIAAVIAGVRAIEQSRDLSGPTNEQVFAERFAPALGRPWSELKPFFARFYEERFPELRSCTAPRPEARSVVQFCFDAGYRVVIATNPLFPARAIMHRLEWAGVGDMPFDLVTTYENMHACKPAPEYYLEIAHRLSLPPSACLMVGNDVMRDIAPAQEAGMRTFLVEPWVVNDNPHIQADGQGSLSELVEWIKQITK